MRRIESGHELQVVRDEQGGRPQFACEVDDEADDLLAARAVQSGRGLVDDEDRRVPHERASDVDTLSLTPGQGGGPCLAVVAQPHGPQQRVRRSPARGPGLRGPVQFAHHQQLFARGERREQVRLLEDDADAFASQLCGLLLRQSCRVDVRDAHTPGIRADERGGDGQEAGLPRTGRPGETGDGAAGDLEVCAVDRGDAAGAIREGEGDVGEREHEVPFAVNGP